MKGIAAIYYGQPFETPAWNKTPSSAGHPCEANSGQSEGRELRTEEGGEMRIRRHGRLVHGKGTSRPFPLSSFRDGRVVVIP